MRPDSRWPALAVAAALLAACGGEVAETEPPLRPVRYITVTDDTGARARTFSGTSRSTQVSRLSFKVSGTLVELPVEIGDRVQAGSLIARLDPASFDLEVQRAQASVVQAEASLRNAEANYERVKGLYANNNSSRNELDSARAAAESAEAQARSAQKALELARLNRSYTRLVAETDCSVAAVNVEINENVATGAEVARVNCGDALEIELAIPDSLIAEIDQDDPVKIEFGSIPDRPFAGTVSEIGVASLSGAPTFPVTVRVDGRERRLRAGLSADVTFRFDSGLTPDAARLPASAVVNDGTGEFVYVAEPRENGREAIVRRVEVEVGELTEAGVEIHSGLASGDRVVTAGTAAIRDGQRVLLD